MINLESFCNYLLRVPLIFIIDELFKSSFEFPDLFNIFPEIITPAFLRIIVSCLIFCLSLCLLILPAEYIFIVYVYLLSVYVAIYSYWINMEILGVLSEKYKNFERVVVNEIITWDVDGIIYFFTQSRLNKLSRYIFIQYYLSLVFEILQIFTINYQMHNIFRYSFFFPTLIASVIQTSTIINTVIIISTLLQLFFLLKTLWLNISIVTTIIQNRYIYIRQFINIHEIFIMIENEWFRLKISNVLRIFWAIRVLIQLLHPQIYIEIQNEALFGAINYLLIKGSDTCITVLAITTFISYLSEYIKKFFQWVLQIDDLDDLNCGVISAILFFMLATQSGLTRLDPENRLIRLFEIICLVCTTLQHQIHDMVNKLLMSLVASLNTSLKRHARALLVCGFLIVFAVTILIYLWSNYLVGPWLLSVIALNIATIIKVLVSLAVYSLLLIDTYYSIIWDKLDDYVFYINSFGNIVEFCIRVFILLISVYNVAFIFGGVVSVFLILTQTYSTIYNARNKWKELTRRSTAIKKIESLSQATSTQLSEFNDVCAICHENMNSARITKCNHYFHGECLRKWFYDNDHCPMCYTISE